MVNLEGLEMITVLATVVLFVKVLEHFGWLADDYGGKQIGPGDIFNRRVPTCCCSFCSLRRAPDASAGLSVLVSAFAAAIRQSKS